MGRVKMYSYDVDTSVGPVDIVNYAAAWSKETQREIGRKTSSIKYRAEALLAEARASSAHEKFFGPEHVTTVTANHDVPDGFIHLNGTNAYAIEFGHRPSGVFGGTDTHPPEGLYIITRAALGG